MKQIFSHRGILNLDVFDDLLKKSIEDEIYNGQDPKTLAVISNSSILLQDMDLHINSEHFMYESEFSSSVLESPYATGLILNQISTGINWTKTNYSRFIIAIKPIKGGGYNYSAKEVFIFIETIKQRFKLSYDSDPSLDESSVFLMAMDTFIQEFNTVSTR